MGGDLFGRGIPAFGGHRIKHGGPDRNNLFCVTGFYGGNGLSAIDGTFKRIPINNGGNIGNLLRIQQGGNAGHNIFAECRGRGQNMRVMIGQITNDAAQVFRKGMFQPAMFGL